MTLWCISFWQTCLLYLILKLTEADFFLSAVSSFVVTRFRGILYLVIIFYLYTCSTLIQNHLNSCSYSCGWIFDLAAGIIFFIQKYCLSARAIYREHRIWLFQIVVNEIMVIQIYISCRFKCLITFFFHIFFRKFLKNPKIFKLCFFGLQTPESKAPYKFILIKQKMLFWLRCTFLLFSFVYKIKIIIYSFSSCFI